VFLAAILPSKQLLEAGAMAERRRQLLGVSVLQERKERFTSIRREKGEGGREERRGEERGGEVTYSFE
jgi:hypothetical protein